MLPARRRSQQASSLPAAVCPRVCECCLDSGRVLTQVRPDVLPCWQRPSSLPTACPQTLQQAGNFLDETLAPRVAHYVTAPMCAAPLAAASGALELQGHRVPEPATATAGTQLLGCQLILGSLHTDPSAEIKHPQPGPIPPLGKPPWSVCNAHRRLAGLPACLPSARDEQETGMVLPEPTAKPARMQNPRCCRQHSSIGSASCALPRCSSPRCAGKEEVAAPVPFPSLSLLRPQFYCSDPFQGDWSMLVPIPQHLLPLFSAMKSLRENLLLTVSKHFQCRSQVCCIPSRWPKPLSVKDPRMSCWGICFARLIPFLCKLLLCWGFFVGWELSLEAGAAASVSPGLSEPRLGGTGRSSLGQGCACGRG